MPKKSKKQNLSTKTRPFLSQSTGTLILICVIACTPALADSWGPPSKEHWSANKNWVLKVGWMEDSTLSLWEKTEDGLKERWRRGYVDRTWPPHQAYPTDDGKFVVLRDLHSRLGYREVIVILGDNGKILGSYKLHEFLPPTDIAQAERSVSSIWWNENAWFSLINDDRQFALVTQVGTVRCFDLPTGRLLDLSDNERAEIVDLARKDAEAWAEDNEFYLRIRGITLLGAMRIEDAIPIAKTLFHDKTRTGSIGARDKPGAVMHRVQAAAGLALIRLMGTDAIPIIEAELPEANWYMRGQLFRILNRLDTEGYVTAGTSEHGIVLEMWKRLARHSDDDVRYPAIYQVLRRDAKYLFDNPDLIHCEIESVRALAGQVLAKVDSPEALTLLREAIRDEQDTIRRQAVRTFIAREPPDIEDVLLPYLEDKDAYIRTDVICELVCRGNAASTEKLWQVIETWPNADLEGYENWPHSWEIQQLCMLIADRRLVEARKHLEAIRSVEDFPTTISVAGALAALGDDDALHDLHRIASEGKMRDRALAIWMCRYLADEKSVSLVKQAGEAKEGGLQHAAHRELLRFGEKTKADDCR